MKKKITIFVLVVFFVAIVATGLWCAGLFDTSVITEGEISVGIQYRDGNFGYIVKDGDAYITAVEKIGLTLEIPETVGGYTVCGFDSDAVGDKREKRLLKLTLPDTCHEFWTLGVNQSPWYKNQDGFVYAGNVLVDIKNHDEVISVTDGTKCISAYAFYHCDAKEIIIPDSVEYIGVYAFDSCRNLVKVNIPDTAEIEIPNFVDCEKLTVDGVICSEMTKELLTSQENYLSGLSPFTE